MAKFIISFVQNPQVILRASGGYRG